MITDPAIDFHWFPLDNPGIVSIPLAFFLGWLGTVTSGAQRAKFAEMEVRSLTGPAPRRRWPTSRTPHRPRCRVPA